MYREEKGRQGIEIFCCYSRKDQSLLHELESHLMPLQREGLIHIWNDTSILPGADWEREVNKHISTAQIILLLISPSFIASEYCYKVYLDFFGWSAYLLALGLVAFAMVQLIEGMRKQHYLRWSLVIGLVILWLLLLLESRLIVGPHVGILAELLVMPFLGWSPAIAHVLTLGLMLITVILTFRITLEHILLLLRRKEL